MWARLTNAIASARLAAWLIGGQVAFLLVSFVIPQRGIFPDDQVEAFLADIPGVVEAPVRFLALDHVFTSALFYATALVLTLNLVVCTWQRAARRTRRSTASGWGPVPGSAHAYAVSDRLAAEEGLATLDWQAIDVGAAESRYYLRRGGVGFIGSVVLHAALVVVLVGAALTGLTTFRGEMILTEGQTRADVPDDYLTISQVPSLGSAFRDFTLTLEDIEFTYERGTVVDAVAALRVNDDAGSRLERARVNYPLKVKGKSFLLQDAGHSVWITVEDAAGVTVADSFVTLRSYTDLGYQDSLPLAAGQLHLVSRPDGALPVSQPVVEGLDVVSPVVGLSLDAADSADDYAWVAPGSPAVELGPYLVTVHEVRVWNRFMVRADGGRYVIYASFLLIIAGSIARFLDPDRWLKAALVDEASGGRLYLWGAERYRAGVLPREAGTVASAVAQAGAAIEVSGDTTVEEADDDC